jgi:sugar phosphate isomerase/epimerase
MAEEALVKSYGPWKRAYGDMGWKEFLSRVVAHPYSGEWVVEVARLKLVEDTEKKS